MLELEPNPLSSPNPTKGYPKSDRASAVGFGAQIGLFYDTKTGFKIGAFYKSTQNFGDMEFQNNYLDNTAAPDVSFNLDYPAIYSIGLGYSKDKFDVALDYRFVDYENTDGFAEKGWTSTAAVKGFGWKNISVVSAGLQLKTIDRLPLRFGYTYSTNPIDEELAFFSTPATAIIRNAFQFGVGYQASDHLTVNAAAHFGFSGGKTEGQLLSPLLVSSSNQYGAVPGSSVSYEMKTQMINLGIEYKF